MKIEEKYCISARDDYISDLAFHPDGEILATCGDDKTIELWDVKTGKKIRAFKGKFDVDSFAFSRDGKTLVHAEYNRIIFRRVDTGEIFNKFVHDCTNPYLSFRLSHIAFSPNGYILAGRENDEIILWQVETGILIRTLEHKEYGYRREIWDIEFSPKGQILATCSEDKTIKLWEVGTGKLIRTLIGHTDEVCGIAFSPNGRILASCSWDNTIKFWDVSTGKKIRTLKKHDYSVSCVAFHPSGKILASGIDDRIQLWDVETGKEICTLNNPSQESDYSREVRSVVFSPDGQLLASADEAGIVKIWHGDLPKKTNIEIVRLIKNQNPTEKS
ncbi:MAG: WD40 repeat domain-containing protein [Okeania sp. SIO3B3]|nr:WD40 repeat domain-containing protein [Okeania sp. SIO3B3]